MDDVIILVMQRAHRDDMAGKLIERGGFDILDLAAIAPADETVEIAEGKFHHRRAGEALHPERMSLEFLKERRLENPQVFDAQYQQDPAASSDAPFKFSDFVRCPGVIRREPGDYYVQSWDTAVKTGSRNDWSACATFLVQYSHMPPGVCSLGKARFHLVDMFRERLDYEGLIQAMANGQRRYRPRAVLVEDTHMIGAIRSGFLRYGLQAPTFVRPIGDKRSRLWAQSNWILQGQVRLPDAAPWLKAFQIELEAFPNGAFDDQIDAFSQFLSWVTKRVGSTVTRSHY
jgi:predicted phage terminase large subunit-like protein